MKTAIIIGAGPAGLTAALELCTRTNIRPVVIEAGDAMGGLARTVNYRGNRMDIGGHRFFSKSDRVMDWWLRILPLQAGESASQITYQNQTRTVSTQPEGPDPETDDKVMLIRKRLSRIYFAGKFFRYPIALNFDTLRKLGLLRVIRIGASYLRAVLFPRPENTLEDFFINRFGRVLYLMFFKSYTEKVWGVPCDRISAEWGAQRVKGLSVGKALSHAVKRMFGVQNRTDVSQHDTQTSLIERFLYPKYGPGQMWEEVACQVRRNRGEIVTGWRVERIDHADRKQITAIWARHAESGEIRRFEGDYYFSTMPVKELVAAMKPSVPHEMRSIADGLVYRDFIIVGVLCNRLAIEVDDNWIYIQDPHFLAGRLQIFNNWSPYLVSDPSKVWIGLEYFCNEAEALWTQSDEQMIDLAKRELEAMKMLDPRDFVDAKVIRVPKTYPAYFGAYDRFSTLTDWLDTFENLYLIGRNGMHKYNNQDHSMLAAMTAVDNIVAGVNSRENLWSLNVEMEYHEEK